MGARQQEAPPPPGWYPDPIDRDQQRYWDGSSWTTHTGIEHKATSPSVEDTGRRATTIASTWERAAFVATYLLGGLLLGPVAMRHAGRAAGARAAGDQEAARDHVRRARIWTIVAGIVGVATIATVLWLVDLGDVRDLVSSATAG